MHSHFERNKNAAPEEVCYSPVESRSCYISCYATQPARQSDVPVWCKPSSTSAKSAHCTINWPHVTAAPLSSICFGVLPDFARFPHLLKCLKAVHQLLIEVAGVQHGVNSPSRFLLPQIDSLYLSCYLQPVWFCIPLSLSTLIILFCLMSNFDSFISRLTTLGVIKCILIV